MMKRLVVLALAAAVALPTAFATISPAMAQPGPPGPGGPGPGPILGPLLGAPPPAPPAPPPGYYDPRPRAVYTDDCVTQYGWCQLSRPLPVGSSCRCFRQDGGSDGGRAEVR